MPLTNPKRIAPGPEGRTMVDEEMLAAAQALSGRTAEAMPGEVAEMDGETVPDPTSSMPGPANWRELIPEDVRGEQFWDKYRDLPAALKGMAEAQKLIGRRGEGARVPGPFASAEELEGFYAAMGRPEAPDGYELPELELPGDLTPDEGVLGAFRDRAHSLGLSADQVRGLYEWFVPHQAEMVQQMERDAALQMDSERQSEFAAFRNEHGTATPRMLARARQAALAVGGPELVEVLAATGAGNSARVLSAFATIAPLVTEAGFQDQGTGDVGMTHEQLRQMRRDPRYADPSQRDPNYVRQVETAYARMFPGTVEGSATARR